MPEEVKRLFVALALPSDVKKTLAGIQKKLQKSGADVKWVETENIHITVKFLGAVRADKLQPVCDALEALVQRRRHFEIRLTSIGAFPSLSSPRVVWVGGADAGDDFKKIAQDVENNLARLGFEKEGREPLPHATLGRVRSPRNKIFLHEKINDANASFAEITVSVSEVTLFESRLAPKGAAYFIVKTFRLAP